MNILKKIPILLFLSMATFFAQDKNNAKAILDKATKQYLSYSTLKGNFKYILIDKIKNSGSRELKKTGKFKMKGDKYHLTLDNPDLIVFYNGKKRVSYRVEEKEYEFLDEDENIFSPQDIFRNYAEQYHYTMGKDAEVNGNLCYTFSLIPKNQDTPAHTLHSSKVKIELFINKTTYEIQKIVTEEDNKRQIVLEIFQLKKNEPIKDQEFDFNPENYPGAEEI